MGRGGVTSLKVACRKLLKRRLQSGREDSILQWLTAPQDFSRILLLLTLTDSFKLALLRDEHLTWEAMSQAVDLPTPEAPHNTLALD